MTALIAALLAFAVGVFIGFVAERGLWLNGWPAILVGAVAAVALTLAPLVAIAAGLCGLATGAFVVAARSL